LAVVEFVLVGNWSRYVVVGGTRTTAEYGIAKLAGFNHLDDPKWFIIVNHASVPQRLDMLGCLCEQLVDEFPNLSQYKNVLARLREAQSARNRYTHNSMHRDESNNGRAKMSVG
jgi:hypothetical protein